MHVQIEHLYFDSDFFLHYENKTNKNYFFV